MQKAPSSSFPPYVPTSLLLPHGPRGRKHHPLVLGLLHYHTLCLVLAHQFRIREPKFQQLRPEVIERQEAISARSYLFRSKCPVLVNLRSIDLSADFSHRNDIDEHGRGRRNSLFRFRG